MKRREFIAGLSGAVAWPVAARAQQSERMRRIGVVMGSAADDADGQARLTGFLQGLKQSGWTEGRDLRIDTRWGAGDSDLFRSLFGKSVPPLIARRCCGHLVPVRNGARRPDADTSPNVTEWTWQSQ